MEVSFNGGDSYTPVSGNFLEGNTGAVSPGEGNQITWNGHESFPNTYSTEAMLKIIAIEVIAVGDWPTDTDTEVVEITNPETGKTWMDRNLGASRAATSSTDEEAYGHLYQWGRAADGHQLIASGTISTLSSSNNPCPAGYRLPTAVELDAERQSWGGKSTAAGDRSRNSGQHWNINFNGYYWSSTVDGTNSHALVFTTGSFSNMSTYNRARGRSLDSVFIEMNKSIDYLIGNISTDEKIFNEITDYLFKLLERRSLFRSSEYPALKGLNQVSCTIDNDLAAQLESYRAMKPGNAAPDIEFSGDVFAPGYGPSYIPGKLSGLDSEYTLVDFGAGWWPGCPVELSHIARSAE